MTVTTLGQLPTNQPAPTGLAQIKRGASNATTTWNNTVPAQAIQDGVGNPMRIAITPPRNGWWIVRAEMIWSTPDAIWTYWHWATLLNTPDVNGWQQDRNHHCIHSALGWTESVINSAFRLSAGVAYWCDMYWPNATLGWNQAYYTGPDYHYIMGEFIADGSF